MPIHRQRFLGLGEDLARLVLPRTRSGGESNACERVQAQRAQPGGIVIWHLGSSDKRSVLARIIGQQLIATRLELSAFRQTGVGHLGAARVCVYACQPPPPIGLLRGVFCALGKRLQEPIDAQVGEAGYTPRLGIAHASDIDCAVDLRIQTGTVTDSVLALQMVCYGSLRVRIHRGATGRQQRCQRQQPEPQAHTHSPVNAQQYARATPLRCLRPASALAA